MIMDFLGHLSKRVPANVLQSNQLFNICNETN